MGRKDRAWILADLESMAVDLQTILDELGDTDDWTVGELKRLRVLGESVKDGATAVAGKGLPAVNPSLTISPTYPSTYPHWSGPYWTWNTTTTYGDSAA
jgi:hypothetical protein